MKTEEEEVRDGMRAVTLVVFIWLGLVCGGGFYLLAQVFGVM